MQSLCYKTVLLLYLGLLSIQACIAVESESDLEDMNRCLDISIDSSRVPTVVGTDFQIRVGLKNVSRRRAKNTNGLTNATYGLWVVHGIYVGIEIFVCRCFTH